jgi:hypothetical protein
MNACPDTEEKNFEYPDFRTSLQALFMVFCSRSVLAAAVLVGATYGAFFGSPAQANLVINGSFDVVLLRLHPRILQRHHRLHGNGHVRQCRGFFG